MIKETPAIRKRINQLYRKSRGVLTPDMVIEDARSRTSPLHGLFEWSENKAAYQHWLDTAREIISCVRVVINTSTRDVEVHRYIHIGGQTPGYNEITKIRSERELAMETLKQEFQCVANALHRAREIAAALGLESEIDALLRQVDARGAAILRRVKRSHRLRSVVRAKGLRRSA
jgi:hypothetical protein